MILESFIFAGFFGPSDSNRRPADYELSYPKFEDVKQYHPV
jgi:hypothetical protein